MKKIMIASDIHGSAYYCRQLLERYKEEKAERLILLGDILYHGPRNDLPKEYAPKEVIAMLNPLRNEILCVRGNCDTEVDQMVLDFNVLCEQAFVDVNGKTLVLAHGHKLDEKNIPALKKEIIWYAVIHTFQSAKSAVITPILIRVLCLFQKKEAHTAMLF